MKVFYISHSVATYRVNTLQRIAVKRSYGFKFHVLYDPSEDNLAGHKTQHVDTDASGTNIPTHFLKSIRCGPFHILQSLGRHIRREKPDILVFATTNGCLSMWWWVLVTRLGFFRCKTVWWSHGTNRSLSLFKRLLYRLILRFNVVMTYNKRGARLLHNLSQVNRFKVVRIGNALDPDLSSNFKPHCNSKPHYRIGDEFVFLYIGRLVSEKRLELGIQLVHKLANHGQPCVFHIVGSGPERENLIRMVSDLNFEEKVFFHSATHDEKEIANYYRQAHACLSPGNIGLFALHAVTYHCPILTHGDLDNQGPEIEILEYFQESILAEYCSLESYLKAANEFIANYDKIRNELEENADNIIATYYHPDIMADIFWETIRDLLNENCN